jgi:hypothetical protein
MPNEYLFIRKFLDNNHELKKNLELKSKFIYLYQIKRFNNYLFSLKRIHEKCRGIFLKRFHEDYIIAEKNQELKKNLFIRKNYHLLQLIIDDPDKFNKEYFSSHYIKKNKLNSIFNFLYLVKKSKGNLKTIYNFLKKHDYISFIHTIDPQNIDYIEENLIAQFGFTINVSVFTDYVPWAEIRYNRISGEIEEKTTGEYMIIPLDEHWYYIYGNIYPK